MPDHRLAAGTAAGHTDQQLCAVQRTLSDFDRSYHDVFRGNRRLIRRFCIVILYAHRRDRVQCRNHFFCDKISVRHNPERSSLFFYPGAAALPLSAGGQGHLTFHHGAHAFCTGPGGRRRRSRRHGFVDSCKCIGERSKSARRLLRFS